MSAPLDVPVTVVIPALNAAGTIGRQLAALRSQIDAPAFRVIVVDNGSIDGTGDVARSFDTAAFGVAVVVEPRRGINVARNAGIQVADDGIVALCDADDEVSATWLARLVADRRERQWWGGGLDYTTLNSPRTRQIWCAPDRSLPLTVGDRFVDRTYGCNCAFRRSMWVEIGRFDESLSGSGGDETEFFMRAHGAGFMPCDVPDALVAYRLRPGTGAMIRQRFRQGRNQVRMEARAGGLLLGGAPAAGSSVIDVARTVLVLPRYVRSKRSFFLWLGALARRTGRVVELVASR